MKKYLLNIFFCLIISACCSLFMLQKNTSIKNKIVGSLVSLLEKEWNSKITVENKLINFFTASIILENGIVTPSKQPHTTWGFEQAKISFSIFDLIFKRKASLSVDLYKVNGTSITTEKSIEIIDHLIDILKPNTRSFPISIKKVFINTGTIKITHKSDTTAKIIFNGTFSFTKGMHENVKSYLGNIFLDESSLLINEKPLIANISGSNFFYRGRKEPNWHITLHNTIKKIASNEDFLCVFSGNWFQENKSFLLQDQHKKINLKCASCAENGFKIEGSLPISLGIDIHDIITTTTSGLSAIVGGQCLVDLSYAAKEDGNFLCQGLLALEQPTYKNINFESIILKNIFINKDISSATIHAIYDPTYSIQGNASWKNLEKTGTLSLANSKEIITAHKQDSPVYWSIQPQQATLSLDINSLLQVKGEYAALLHNSINEESKSLQGTINAEKKAFTLEGSSESYLYKIKGVLDDSLYFTQIKCSEKNKNHPVIDFKELKDENKTLQGSLEYSLIQQLLPNSIKNKILGKRNKIFLALKQNTLPIMEGKMWVENGKFFIPSLQNMIKSGQLTFNIDPVEKKITLQDIFFNFAKGSINIPVGHCFFDKDSWAIKNLYAPISLNNVLINLKKDFYSFVYGNLLLQQHEERPLNLSGSLVLNKTLVRGDVFSDEQSTQVTPLEQFQAFNNEIDFSIRVINEKPIILKTPTIDALAHIDLQATHKKNPTTAQLPQVTGTVSIDAGHLKFLENKLKIEYGKIQFLTRQLHDPVIDLIAKNRINKYIVTLQVTGSLQKPTVILESTPELGEEQILGLLFTGSENATFQTDLPVMIMQNLNTILLGHRKPYDKTSLLLDTLSKPLKYVQITPDFTDQSGRSSVRALVSVPLGKQLKAQFQKNLTFDDDLGVEIDYLVSDDINLKLVKDQRGELGSEVEVRLKF